MTHAFHASATQLGSAERREPDSPIQETGGSSAGPLAYGKAQQRDVEAAWVERQFKESWKRADTQLEISGL